MVKAVNETAATKMATAMEMVIVPAMVISIPMVAMEKMHLINDNYIGDTNVIVKHFYKKKYTFCF